MTCLVTYAVAIGNALECVTITSTGIGDGTDDVAQLRSGC